MAYLSEERLIVTHKAAVDVWAQTQFASPRITFALRQIPRTNRYEIFTMTEDPKPDSTIYYFASVNPNQLYACVASKCKPHHVIEESTRLYIPYYIITDSEEDLMFPNKSPLRPIGCTIALYNTNVDARRAFAVDRVAPVVQTIFYNPSVKDYKISNPLES